MTPPASTAPQGQDIQLPTLWGAIVKHKRAAILTGLVLAAVILSLVLAVALGSNAGPVTDATTCTQWGSTTQNRQTTYAQLYVREHGTVPHYGRSPALVIDAINFGCGVAYGDDVSDSTTVAQAIAGSY